MVNIYFLYMIQKIKLDQMTKKIFILEDDKVTLMMYTRIFKNYDITMSTTVEDAITICTNTKFDLYIVDILILGSSLSGEDLINLDISPVLVITAFRLDEFKHYSHINYIRKPTKPSTLLAVVENIINGSTTFDYN